VVHCSLVIPAYNESDRISQTLDDVAAYFAAQDYASEVIVVDDGSDDGTAEVVAGDFPAVRLIRYEPNRGKGCAVRLGMQEASGAYRVFYDADGSTPISEIEKLWPCFEAGADIVIGSRSLQESDVQVHQAWYRENMGRVFNRILRLAGLTQYPDTQCGFKGLSAAACDVVFPRQTIERFSFDAELLAIAARHGLRIDQVPVRWINCPGTRVSLGGDSARMLLDLFAIRSNLRSGRYD
jgi:dolichyl-phosphate beta-glucosyltransferase